MRLYTLSEDSGAYHRLTYNCARLNRLRLLSNIIITHLLYVGPGAGECYPKMAKARSKLWFDLPTQDKMTGLGVAAVTTARAHCLRTMYTRLDPPI